jgi:hypothetical protein
MSCAQKRAETAATTTTTTTTHPHNRTKMKNLELNLAENCIPAKQAKQNNVYLALSTSSAGGPTPINLCFKTQKTKTGR